MLINEFFCNFTVGSLGLQSAYIFSSACLSAFVQNLAISEFLMVTPRFHVSFIIDVYSSDFITDEPGAKTSSSLSRLFLDSLFFGFFFAIFNVNEASVPGTGRPTSGCEITLSSLWVFIATSHCVPAQLVYSFFFKTNIASCLVVPLLN